MDGTEHDGDRTDRTEYLPACRPGLAWPGLAILEQDGGGGAEPTRDDRATRSRRVARGPLRRPSADLSA
eukprot:15435385-Alexandrium_andersonii.AAC.1